MSLQGPNTFLIVVLVVMHWSLHNFVSASIFIRKELLPCEVNSAGKFSSGNLTSCTRKVFLSLKIIQDKKAESKHQFVIVDSVYDVTSQEEVRLTEPLVIKVIQQPVTLAYPLKYMFAANNKPYEVIINKKIASNYTGCDPLATYQPACQKYEHLAPNRARNGKAITQGFCCPCELTNGKNARENLVCGSQAAPTKEEVDPQGTTHCLRFDPVWYSVNSLKPPIFHHKIGIGIYIEDRQETGRRNWRPLVPSFPQFSLGTQNKKVQHEKVAASYLEITDKPSGTGFPLDHQKQSVLIPQPHVSTEDHSPPQTKQSPGQFLVVNKTMIDQTGNTCDKIGVSYGAFDRQQNRCHSPVNTCLGNSIQDMWLHDMKSATNGSKKKYFLSAFGSLSEPAVIQEPNLNPLLLFKITYEHISHVYIDINADLIQTVNQVHGEIVEGISISGGRTTEIEVHVHNHGLVTTLFTIHVAECSSSMEIKGKHTESIGPYASATFLFTLRSTDIRPQSVISTCRVELLNRGGQKIAQRTISYQPMHRCFCIAQCACKCTSQTDWYKCERMSKKEYQAAGIAEELHARKVAHIDDVTLGAEFFVFFLIILLLLGILKCLIGLVNEFWSAFTDGRLYHDIREPWKEHRLRRMCLDIWFFYYCPFLLFYLCIHHLIKKCTHRDEQNPNQNQNSIPEKKVSEVFLTTKEDLGKFVVSDSEDETGNVESQSRSQPDATSMNNNAEQFSEHNLRPSSNLSKRESATSVDLENENNSRKFVPSTVSMTGSGLSIDHHTAASEEPTRVSSSTSVLSKKAIERQFRKQKARLNDMLKEEADLTSSVNPGSITTITTSEISSLGKSQDSAADNISKKDPDEESLSGADFEVLNVLSSPGRPVFCNYLEKTTRLRKSGDSFSLCGLLRKSGLYYKFTLGPYNTQIFSNKRGKVKKLVTPLPISTKNFVQVMTGAQALQKVTLEPRYPCLNYVTSYN